MSNQSIEIPRDLAQRLSETRDPQQRLILGNKIQKHLVETNALKKPNWFKKIINNEYARGALVLGLSALAAPTVFDAVQPGGALRNVYEGAGDLIGRGSATIGSIPGVGSITGTIGGWGSSALGVGKEVWNATPDSLVGGFAGAAGVGAVWGSGMAINKIKEWKKPNQETTALLNDLENEQNLIEKGKLGVVKNKNKNKKKNKKVVSDRENVSAAVETSVQNKVSAPAIRSDSDEELTVVTENAPQPQVTPAPTPVPEVTQSTELPATLPFSTNEARTRRRNPNRDASA